VVAAATTTLTIALVALVDQRFDDPEPDTAAVTAAATTAGASSTPGSTAAMVGASTTVPRQQVCPTTAATTCVATDQGDVDGDGSADAVGLFKARGTEGFGAITVRVVFAGGRTEDYQIDDMLIVARLLGVTDLDGDGRDEVVFLHAAGAHAASGTLLGTATTGELHPVGLEPGNLLVDDSANATSGMACPDIDGDGQNELVLGGAYGFLDGRVDAFDDIYRWRGDVLEQIDHESYSTGLGDYVNPHNAHVGVRCGDLDPYDD
jgi:hypothetical protein